MNSLTEVDWSTIPKPTDDGDATHLPGMELPAMSLTATDGTQVELNRLVGTTIIYAYPMTGRPDVPLPDGWDTLPGARGCTPQSCAFRDHADELSQLGVNQLYGLSTQSSEYQKEAAGRLHLPFVLLSDNELAFTTQMRLPTMEVEGNTLIKRLTLVVRNTKIIHSFYPVFPPDENASRVIEWLKMQ